MFDDQEYVRAKHACVILQVSMRTLHRWGAEGKLPEYRDPVYNYRFYKRSDLEEVFREMGRPMPREEGFHA